MNEFWVQHYDEKSNILTKLKLEPSKDYENYKNCLEIGETMTKNDRFERKSIVLNPKISGQMYIVYEPEENEINRPKKYMKNENYVEYLDRKNKIKDSNKQWIFNILDGKNEIEKIFYQDNNFILIPDFQWDCQDKDRLHVLAIVKDKSISSIRDLDSSHLDLLQHINTIAPTKISKKYNVDENKFRAFLHYPPSTWILHIHFIATDNFHGGTDISRCYKLIDVIKNIQLDENYYKQNMQVLESY